MPVGSPLTGSLTISPPGGETVSFPILASFKARLLTRTMCPSKRLTQTGLSGLTGSIHSFRGSSGGWNCSWSQSPLSIQLPAGSSAALAAIRLTNSSRLRQSRSLMDCRAKPPVKKWVWASMKPGRTKAPFRSITFDWGPINFFISESWPVAIILLWLIARAETSGLSELIVQTWPLSRTRSAMVPPFDWQPIANKQAIMIRTDSIRTESSGCSATFILNIDDIPVNLELLCSLFCLRISNWG